MDILVFWVALLVIILSYMSLWYGISLITRRYDVVDSAWGLGFVLVAWVGLALRGNFGIVQAISAVLVSAWGLRLFAHIAARNWRKTEDDARYLALRQKWGKAAGQQKVYTHVFLLQGMLLALVSSPMIAIGFTRTEHPHFLTYIGWIIWLAGILFEAVADRQLTVFIRHRAKGSHAVMDHGLWRYSRHPNYFGEVTTWWGAALVAISIGNWWGLVGAALITWLITKVSGIPPLERHYDGNKIYESYRRRTSVLLPRPPRKPTEA